MALNSSGAISLGGSTTGQSVAVELGVSATGQISLNDTVVRTLAGVSSGAISLYNLYSKSNAGSQSYTTPGIYSWIAPAGVTSVSVVVVGSGGNGANGEPSLGYAGFGGGGGALAYKNNISVTPGTSYTVVVLNSGNGRSISSYFSSSTVVAASGGANGVARYPGCKLTYRDGRFDALGGTVVAGTGGAGGRGRNGPGGAGGYGGAGGRGGCLYDDSCMYECVNTGDVIAPNQAPTAGSCGGGGGGVCYSAYGSTGAGGVGIFGKGANGAAGYVFSNPPYGTYLAGGGGGSGGGTAGCRYYRSIGTAGGNYGGGGGGGSVENNCTSPGAVGGKGAVRIVWPGTTRQFPSTNVGSP